MGIKPEKSVNVIENKKHFYYVYAQGMLGAITNEKYYLPTDHAVCKIAMISSTWRKKKQVATQ